MLQSVIVLVYMVQAEEWKNDSLHAGENEGPVAA